MAIPRTSYAPSFRVVTLVAATAFMIPAGWAVPDRPAEKAATAAATEAPPVPAPEAAHAAATGVAPAGPSNTPSPGSFAPELPIFKPGLWEYRRSTLSESGGNPKIASVRRCADPTDEIRKKFAALTSNGCQFLPMRHRDDHYLAHGSCRTPKGDMRFRDELIAKSATRYQDVSETHWPARVDRSVIDATRLGDCAAGAADAGPRPSAKAPSAPTPKP